jgi:predicted MFS family arabinose efflux permease
MAPVSSVSLEPYRRALASRRLRTALLLGLMVRAPVFAGGVLLTVHTVTTLGGSYSAAGVLVAVVTAATAVSGPWRGRLLDRLGLRRVVPPLLLVTATCWTIAPWVGYRGLLALALVASVLVIPSVPIIRQAVIASVPEQDRRSAISLDTAGFELAFVVAPLVAVWAAAQWSTAWVLFISKMLVVLAGAVIWLVDPPLRAMSERTAAEHDVPRREWFSTRVLVVCLLAFGVTLVLTGSEIGVVAAMRGWGLTPQIGVVLAVLGVGSLLGGLVYGAMPRPLPAHLLLLALALVTVPMAFVSSAWTLVVLSFAAGLFTAPTVTATVDQLSGMVPAETRGEAMGWHGSSLAAGGTLGAPLAGMAIDRYGVGGGFAAVALGGVALALLAVPFMRSGRSAARSALVRTGTG